jgi:hypothetical protein
MPPKIEYERVDEEIPASFPWVVILKLLIAVVAIPVTLWLVWLLVLICYWVKYGKWPGWDASSGG